MDKLELDARVARLERSLTFLWTLVGLGVAAVAAVALFAVRSHPSEAATRTAVVESTPGMAAPAAMLVEGSEPTTMADLERGLRLVQDLCQKDLINIQDRDAKKRQLIARPLMKVDIKPDLEKVKSLWDHRIISGEENDLLKKRVLNIDE